MVADLTLTVLSIEVSPNPSSNDHQARLLLDGKDWLEGHLGLDPPELVAALSHAAVGETLVGRCGCGCVGCDDILVEIERSPGIVAWLWDGHRIGFDASQYAAEVERFIADQSWRPIERQAELAVEGIFEGLTLEGNLKFRWASTRIKPNVIHVSFEQHDVMHSDYGQRLLEFSWDGATIESARDRAVMLRSERFRD